MDGGGSKMVWSRGSSVSKQEGGRYDGFAWRQQGSGQWLWLLLGGWMVGVEVIYGESRQSSSSVVVVGGGELFESFMIVSSFLQGF